MYKLEQSEKTNMLKVLNQRLWESKRDKVIIEKILPVLKKFDGKQLTKRVDTALKALNLEYEGKKILIYAHWEYSSFIIFFQCNNYDDRRTLYMETTEPKSDVFSYDKTMERIECLIDNEKTLVEIQRQIDKIDNVIARYNDLVDKVNELEVDFNGIREFFKFN
jgi:hypothetical protein